MYLSLLCPTRSPAQRARQPVATLTHLDVRWAAGEFGAKATATLRHCLPCAVLVGTIAHAAAGIGRNLRNGRPVATMIRMIGSVVRPGGLDDERHSNGECIDAHKEFPRF